MADKILVLIAGTAGAGKDSLGGFLREVFEPWFDVRHDYFAYTLKSFAHQALGTPWEILNGVKEIKESTNFTCAGEDTGVTIRHGLQNIGEWWRQAFSAKVWANSVRLRAKDSTEKLTYVTDCRHPVEEIFWMQETCSEFARVFVVRIRNSRVPVKRGHPSEDRIADEPDSSFDFLVENEGTLEDLQSTARELACAISLLASTGRTTIKSVDGWIATNADGHIPFAPVISEEEAFALTLFLDNPFYKAKPVVITLRGNACAS